MSAPLCLCDPPESSVKAVAGKSSKHAGREFWSCRVCDFFQWVDHGGTTLSAAGPQCRCGHPSHLRITRKAGSNCGRSFWTCANTGGYSCGFFQWESADWEPPADSQSSSTDSTRSTEDQSCKKCGKAVKVMTVSENNQKGNAGRLYYKCPCGTFDWLSAPKPSPLPSSSLPGSAEYVVDELTRRQLQKLFDIPFGTTTGVGRDYREDGVTPYDYLKVECAWRVSNPQREKRYVDFVKTLPKVTQESMVQSKLSEMQDALLPPLEAGKNEMLLLHGTKPQHLYNILFEGLDPHLSMDGLFGKGSYLAEDAAKVDQYLTKDPVWKGHAPEHELHSLHKKLYERGVKHANDVYYALVCRAALGEMVVTQDGETAVTGENIFKDPSRSALKGGKFSILAEVGKKVKRFREFVVFDPAALNIDFLVALKRVRHYCDCGQAAVQRTVTNGRPENFGRDILFCPGKASGGCGFIHMLPSCYCGRSAEVGRKKNGDRYFRCGSKRDFCDFKDWNGPPQSKRLRGESVVTDQKCTDDSDAVCAPYEYLAHGAGKVFAQIMTVSTTVAECHEQEMQFSDADVGCLKPAEKGCNMIRDSVTCTNSREERPYEYIAGFKVKGQPCVWCGGGQCHDGADTLCEPYDYALYGAGHAFHTKYSHGPFYKAFCNKDAQPGAEMLPADWQIHGMRMHVDCGKPFPVWAKVGQRCGFCKVLVPSIKEDYKTCKDYCASQGNLQCASAALSSISSCDAKETKSCDYAFQVYEHGLCECSFKSTLEAANEDFGKALASPSKADMQCLKKAEKGCKAITDRLNCLSSVDDGFQDSVKGLKVKGEPCVWCGGVACTSKDPAILCEARDYLVNGKGLAFVHRHVAPENVDVAKCEAPKRSFGNVGCLKRQEKGCNSIKDMDTCLSSIDGRPYDQVAGLQVEGQPCVWCGGVPCNSNNGNLCEPYDFALHGEGHAYDVNHAEDNYYTAACEAGQPVKHTTSTAAERVGISTLVDCGTPQPIWKGVGKTCGQCKVQVAIEAAKSYGNCSGYCQAQGLACEKAYSSHLHSCDLRSEEPISCQQSFDNSTGFLCQCQAQQAQQVQQEAQAMYGQCGGKDWKGYTRCKAGAICNVVDADFSQCVPSGAAKPGVRVEAPLSLASTLSAAAPSLSLQDDLGSAPPTAVEGSSCSSHPKCAALKLAGECCPNTDGVRLDCCSKGTFDTSSVVLNPVAATPATPAAPEATLEAAPEANQPSEWWKIPKPSQEQLKCMPSEPKGCGSIKHKLMCLSRVDGRIGYAPHGLNVGGEPCVWCGGGPCTTYSDAVCEPYNWLVNGQGKAFGSQNSAPATWLVAKCQDDRNSVFNDLGCLRKSEIGCNHITEKHQCLASLDARPYVEVAGFKARAQPCVWCGGGTCHSNNGNLCEPYDFVMNGQGQAFKSNYGFNTYMVAECTQDGRVLPMSYPHADVDRGLPTQVTCGEKVTWNGVGKVCGDCDVTVPNIFVGGAQNSHVSSGDGDLFEDCATLPVQLPPPDFATPEIAQLRRRNFLSRLRNS
eukprot:s3559_g2.t2